jgi:hypothetical protein
MGQDARVRRGERHDHLDARSDGRSVEDRMRV